SSAVVYANSVLGARCNRNSGVLELFGSILGKVPNFGFLTDEGRKATWIIEVKTKSKPEAQILGSAIGMKVMEDVPYIKGLSKFLGTDLNNDVKAYFKDMGAATASNGAVGLYHVEDLTPEAVEKKTALIKKGAKVYVIDDAELLRVKASYPCMWKNPDAKPGICFIGCPHLSVGQLKDWTGRIEKALAGANRRKVAIPTILTAAPEVLEAFNKTPEAQRLKKTGAKTSYICPLMYMNNPLCRGKAAVTNSNKLRTYTTSRYYTDNDILAIISRRGK
ncbi:MAG: aconitase X, partial [Spirochaetota bacterium]